MYKVIILILLLQISLLGGSQTYVKIVFHKDLLQRALENGAVKQAALASYANKLDAIMKKREKITFYLGVIEEVQHKIVASLANVDDALKNGKTLYYLGKKLPAIYKNLEEAIQLAIQHPYLEPYVYDASAIISSRLVALVEYVDKTISKDDWEVLISPVKRDKFVRETYDDLMILYWFTGSMVSNFKLYSIQDAVNKIIPYQVYINRDRALISDILSKLKY